VFWLFTQMFVLCAGAFLAGALLTWLPMRAAIRRLRAEVVANRGTYAVLPASLVTQTMVIEPEPEPEEPSIKGNSKSMICHTPSSPYYGRTKGDVAFRSVEEAERAGYTIWSARSRVKVSA
jgi:hypothetical protein